MAFGHGKAGYLSLDNLAGTPTDVSAYLNGVSGFEGKTDRAVTTTFGARAQRRQVLGLRDGGPVSLAGQFNPAGSFIHGKNVVLLLDEYLASADFKSCVMSRAVDQPETHTFGDSWRERGVPGLLDGSLKLDGFFNPAALGSDPMMRDLLAQEAGAVFTLGLNGTAIGQVAEMGQGVAGEYLIPVTVNDVVPVSASFEGEDAFDTGVFLHALGAETGTVNGASVDEAAVSAFGGVAHLNVTTYVTFTSVTIKVQHSDDDAIWVDLIAFTAVTAIGAQRAATAAITTSVNRYTRAIISAVGGAGSITFSVAFARRGYVGATAGRHRHWASMIANTFTHPTQSYSYIFGPLGSTGGFRKLTGELVPVSYELSASVDAVSSFTVQMAHSGAIAEGTF